MTRPDSWLNSFPLAPVWRKVFGGCTVSRVPADVDPRGTRGGGKKRVDSDVFLKADRICPQARCGVREKGFEEDARVWGMRNFQKTGAPLAGQGG